MDSPARACDPAGMLVELAVRDLALLERATLTFGTGLNVITGETGAGKSLLLTALQLLLGRRARADLVRRGSDRARVEGRFVLAMDGYGESVVAWLREHLPETLEEGLEEGAEGELELILTRTVGRDGRSRAHVNHRPVTSRILRELAERLVEIHGQNDQQKLFDPVEQIRLLDTYGGLVDQAEGYRERRSRWLAAAERLENLEELINAAAEFEPPPDDEPPSDDGPPPTETPTRLLDRLAMPLGVALARGSRDDCRIVCNVSGANPLRRGPFPADGGELVVDACDELLGGFGRRCGRFFGCLFGTGGQ